MMLIGMRVVLLMEVWHPELSEAEWRAVQFVFDVLNGEHDLYKNEEKRRKAEEKLAASRAFPPLRPAPKKLDS
jgi:hypothetical protein